MPGPAAAVTRPVAMKKASAAKKAAPSKGPQAQDPNAIPLFEHVPIRTRSRSKDPGSKRSRCKKRPGKKTTAPQSPAAIAGPSIKGRHDAHRWRQDYFPPDASEPSGAECWGWAGAAFEPTPEVMAGEVMAGEVMAGEAIAGEAAGVVLAGAEAT